MATTFLTSINLSKNELQNALLHPLATDPSTGAVGQVYYNSTDKVLKVYDGSAWKAVGSVLSVNGKTGAVTLTQDDVDNGTTYVRTHNDFTDALKNAAEGALQKTGGTMTGAIAMGTNKITGLGTPTADADASTKKYVDDTAANYIPTSLKGANNGVAELDSTGKVPSSQLPSFVDDVLEYDNLAAFPATGETGKIYVAKDTNKTYRWSGSAYVEISASLALGETSSTAYAGDKGKEAHDLASAALPKSGGTMSGAIAMGSNKITGLGTPTANTDAATKAYVDSAVAGGIHSATGTIGTSATSAEVSYTGTLVNAYATMGGSIVVCDMAVTSTKVTFTVASAPASAVTCTVIYA